MLIIIGILHQNRQNLILGKRIPDITRPLRIAPLLGGSGLAVDAQLGGVVPAAFGGALLLVFKLRFNRTFGYFKLRRRL